uniref:Uncharacterized protein n=1 Tax=Rousettus aegyptiacus TaxID=9407 RepID=A0A7J8B7P5_ROUAE|nr:hypothetical protein HJG63_010029 [Rousettus aegyptiacus]
MYLHSRQDAGSSCVRLPVSDRALSPARDFYSRVHEPYVRIFSSRRWPAPGAVAVPSQSLRASGGAAPGSALAHVLFVKKKRHCFLRSHSGDPRQPHSRQRLPTPAASPPGLLSLPGPPAPKYFLMPL